ncbi:MAG: adenylyl-sulfate kinase [Nitrospirae bacterium]|nr:adenylyl-sulfate kinase [Nitrospirota bacterium]
MAKNVVWHKGKINKEDRWLLNNHKSALIWITGLSASGKSTIANELEHYLFRNNIRTVILDGDNVRHGLNKDLGFSATDRKENLRRVGEVAKLLVNTGIITIAAFISPYKSDRLMIRQLFNEGEFIETYLKCDICVCEERDPKGLYKKARRGEIPNFTGISDPYEVPDNPELTVETDILSIDKSVKIIIEHLKKRGLLN